ncbi:MAG: hypothetical protein K2M64_01430 [Clostridia bacterium]|nr:hypothetical protein [Clostridia bacterium]
MINVNFEYEDDVAQLFLDTVPDPAMRSILFETSLVKEPELENVAIGGYKIIKTMKRILNLAYVIALTRWKQLKDDTKWGNPADIEYFEKSRFTKLFQNAIAGEDITLDMQIFSLIELWVDLKEARNHVPAQFNMIFDNEMEDKIGLTLQSVRNVIKNTSFKGSDGSDIDKEKKKYCNKLCYQLLSSFLIFSGATVDYPADNRINDPKDFAISYKLDFRRKVVLYPNTVFGDEKFIATKQQIDLLSGAVNASEASRAPKRLNLFMRTDTSVFKGEYQNRYTSLDGERQAILKTTKKADLDTPEELIKDIHETRKFLSFSYKNIREFAMIINDSIKTADTKRMELFSICQNQYAGVIPCGDSWKIPNIYWDNIITLMMLEMGVSDFLEKIFCEETLFNNVLDNIAWRYKGSVEIDKIRERHKESEKEIISPRNIDDKEANNLYEQQKIKLRIKTVLKAMNFSTEEDDGKNPFLESLTYKYQRIESCIDGLKNRKNKGYDELDGSAVELQKIFADIFRFLQVFYMGLDGYSKELMVRNEKYDAEVSEARSDGVITYEERERIRNMRRSIRKECSSAFKQEARETLDKIKGQNVSQLFEGFCDLCMKYNTFSERGGFDVSEEAKRLKYVIARNYICDANKLKTFATVKTVGDKSVTIFDVLLNWPAYVKSPEFPEWLNYLKDIFMFLIYNEDYSEPGIWKTMKDRPLEDKDCDPIYPYLVTYYKENVDRDNVKKCIYRVPIPDMGDNNGDTVVTLLTDEEYIPQTYFCIPLRYGSSDKWWINPFLIPKRVISDLSYTDTKIKD